MSKPVDPEQRERSRQLRADIAELPLAEVVDDFDRVVRSRHDPELIKAWGHVIRIFSEFIHLNTEIGLLLFDRIQDLDEG